jgi:PadR family transcriptional regulator PadR
MKTRKNRDREKNELLPGTLEMLVLKTLSIETMHGYGIAQHIQKMSVDVLQVEEGSLYPALQRMLLKGWVTAEWKTSANNRRARFYKLTAAGRKQLGIEESAFEQIFDAIRRVMRTT